jgi:hypothetical protein
LIEPETSANLHGTALAILVQQKQEVYGMYQVRAFAEQAFTLAHRFAHQIKFAMLQVSEAAMDDACRPAGHSRSEIVLLDQQSALAGAGTLARDSHSIDAASDDYHLKVLSFQRGSRFYG